MSNDNERSVASAGSQPVAWAVEFDGEVEPFCLSFDKGKAIGEAGGVGLVVPLYRSPTLTDEEKEAIALAKSRLGTSDGDWQADDVLAVLLERPMNKPDDAAEPSLASAGSQPVAWMVEWTDHAAFFLHKPDAEKVAAGDMAVQSLYRQPQPALTDEERHAIAVVRNCAMTRAERFLTQSDAEREATLVLWRLRERLG